MIILDAQLSPDLAAWIHSMLRMDCVAVRDLGLRDASDEIVFARARQMNAIVMTKDADFVRLLEHYGPPPKLIWLTCGNTSTIYLQTVLRRLLPDAIAALEAGDRLVEIGKL